MTINLALCDDNPDVLQQLSDNTLYWSRESNVEINLMIFNDVLELLTLYNNCYRADLIFINICFKNRTEDGYWAAKKIKTIDDAADIVFISGNDKYILEGYDVAIKYIIKPFSDTIIHDFLNQWYVKHSRTWEKSHIKESLIIKSDQGTVVLPLCDIYYIESIGHYLEIHTNSTSIKSHMPLKEIEKLLNESFIVKCHRAFMINLLYVYTIRENEIILFGDHRIPLSRREKEKNFKKLINYQNARIEKGNLLKQIVPHT